DPSIPCRSSRTIAARALEGESNRLTMFHSASGDSSVTVGTRSTMLWPSSTVARSLRSAETGCAKPVSADSLRLAGSPMAMGCLPETHGTYKERMYPSTGGDQTVGARIRLELVIRHCASMV